MLLRQFIKITHINAESRWCERCGVGYIFHEVAVSICGSDIFADDRRFLH